MGNRRRSIVVRAVVATAVGVTSIGLAVATGSAQTPSLSFDATASADGVRISLEVPGAPLTVDLVDLGGPTAQVAVNTLGTSRGYGALPDPGELVSSAPGLVVGLLNQGAFGLPPIEVPSLPDYPLLVRSDVNSTPTAQLGAGPYSITASSERNHSTVDAVGGLFTPAGDVAAVRTAVEAGEVDGKVVARARSQIDGLTIGPISLGTISSHAEISLDENGRTEQKSGFAFDALRIGGISLDVGPDGLRVAGQFVPVPVEDLLAQLLAPLGFDVSYQAAQKLENTVVAPTLTIETQVDVDIGTAPGTLTVTLGGSSATLTGAPLPEVGLGPPVEGVTPPVATASEPPTFNAGTSPSPAPRPFSVSRSPSGPTPQLQAQPVVSQRAPQTILGQFDIRPTYLSLVAAGALAYAMSQIIRLLGVRIRWT